MSVIGGRPAGLTAAWYLAECGLSTGLFGRKGRGELDHSELGTVSYGGIDTAGYGFFEIDS